MICMCNKMKTKASILQQYLFCLAVYKKIVTKTIHLISVVYENVNIEVGTKKQSYLGLLTFVNSEGIVFRWSTYISNQTDKEFAKFARFEIRIF